MCAVLDAHTSCGFAVMSPIEKEPPEQASDAEFRRILAEVREAKVVFEELSGRGAQRASFSAGPLANTIFSIEEKRATAANAGSPWDAALAWIDEQDGPTAVVEARRDRPESAEAILDELGLHDDLTADELNQVRRLFMWRNHPDRQSQTQRDSATRRVAIANMLLDRAQARLGGGRRV
jgi:hypothetical protein